VLGAMVMAPPGEDAGVWLEAGKRAEAAPFAATAAAAADGDDDDGGGAGVDDGGYSVKLAGVPDEPVLLGCPPTVRAVGCGEWRRCGV